MAQPVSPLSIPSIQVFSESMRLLPNEILRKIFELINANSLLNLRTVCKIWKIQIDATPHFSAALAQGEFRLFSKIFETTPQKEITELGVTTPNLKKDKTGGPTLWIVDQYGMDLGPWNEPYRKGLIAYRTGTREELWRIDLNEILSEKKYTGSLVELFFFNETRFITILSDSQVLHWKIEDNKPTLIDRKQLPRLEGSIKSAEIWNHFLFVRSYLETDNKTISYNYAYALMQNYAYVYPFEPPIGFSNIIKVGNDYLLLFTENQMFQFEISKENNLTLLRKRDCKIGCLSPKYAIIKKSLLVLTVNSSSIIDLKSGYEWPLLTHFNGYEAWVATENPVAFRYQNFLFVRIFFTTYKSTRDPVFMTHILHLSSRKLLEINILSKMASTYPILQDVHMLKEKKLELIFVNQTNTLKMTYDCNLSREPLPPPIIIPVEEKEAPPPVQEKPPPSFWEKTKSFLFGSK